MITPLSHTTAPHEAALASLSSSGASRSSAAAQEFESVFVGLLLKQMRQSLSGEGLIPGDNGDIIGGLFDQYLGEHIAASGGLGLADALAGSLP